MARRSDRQTAWAQGGLKLVGRRVLEHYNKHVRPFRPRCDATRKNGEPCRNLPLSGSSKCRIHGGATPRGDDWHKPQWPSGSRPDWQKKLREKLARLDRDRRRLERRLAKMTTEERRRYDRWRWDHEPGSSGDRAQRRSDRKIAAEIRECSARAKDRPISPEIAALQKQAAELEAERDRLLRQIEDDKPIGVFS